MSATQIQISQFAFRSIQVGAVTILMAFGALHDIYFSINGIDMVSRALSIFDVGREDSIPTAFSIINLLVSSILLFALYYYSKQYDRKYSIYWAILCLIMFGLAVDEAAGVHERLSKLQMYTGSLIPVDESYSWVVYGAVFCVAVFLFFVPFLLRIERLTAAFMVLSGAIFVTGALGFETVAGWMLYAGFADSQDLAYFMTQLFEEGLEMAGIALFNCTLLDYCLRRQISFKLTVSPRAPDKWREAAASKDEFRPAT